MAGRLADGRVVLEVVQRFAKPRAPADGPALEPRAPVHRGARQAAPHGGLRGIGVDTWGVDYGLLDGDGNLLGLPFHYRDGRTEGMAERAFDRVSAAELYAVTGIQTLPINTVFQLLAEEESAALSAAQGIALIPDLLAFWLSGELANESSAASTTGLLDARTGQWALGVHPTAGPSIDAVRRRRRAQDAPSGLRSPITDLGPVPVCSVAGHDGLGVRGRPRARPARGVLSSGTWCLLGLKLDEPVLTDAAREPT